MKNLKLQLLVLVSVLAFTLTNCGSTKSVLPAERALNNITLGMTKEQVFEWLALKYNIDGSDMYTDKQGNKVEILYYNQPEYSGTVKIGYYVTGIKFVNNIFTEKTFNYVPLVRDPRVITYQKKDADTENNE